MMRQMTAALKDAQPGVFTCSKGIWCVARARSGEWIVVLEDGRFAGKACDIADIVVVSRRTSFSKCRSGALLLNRDTLRRTGSVEINFAGSDQSAVVGRLRAAIAGANRPWSEHRYYDWKSDRFEYEVPEPVRQLLTASQ